jgi:hypothetical protein
MIRKASPSPRTQMDEATCHSPFSVNACEVCDVDQNRILCRLVRDFHPGWVCPIRICRMLSEYRVHSMLRERHHHCGPTDALLPAACTSISVPIFFGLLFRPGTYPGTRHHCTARHGPNAPLSADATKIRTRCGAHGSSPGIHARSDSPTKICAHPDATTRICARSPARIPVAAPPDRFPS